MQLPTFMSLRHIRHLVTVDVIAVLCPCLILSIAISTTVYLTAVTPCIISYPLLPSINYRTTQFSTGFNTKLLVSWSEAIRTGWLNEITPLASSSWKNKIQNSLAGTQGSDDRNTMLPSQHSEESSNFLNILIPRNKFEAKSFKFSSLGHGIAYPHNSGPLIRSASSRLTSRPIFSHGSEGRSSPELSRL